MQQQNSFNPREHLMTIKNRQGPADYLPVQWRLVWFREQCPKGTISTEIVHLDLDKEVESQVMQWDEEARRMKAMTKHGYGVAVFKASVTDGNGGTSTGYGSEKASDFGDFLEKAETKAIGRALAALGFGTQFAPELSEAPRIVDSPVDQSTNPVGASSMIQSKQLDAIKTLCKTLSQKEPERLEEMSFEDAKSLIQKLTAQYRDLNATKPADPPEQTPDISTIYELYSRTYASGGWGRFVKATIGEEKANEAISMEERSTLWTKLQRMIATARK